MGFAQKWMYTTWGPIPYWRSPDIWCLPSNHSWLNHPYPILSYDIHIWNISPCWQYPCIPPFLTMDSSIKKNHRPSMLGSRPNAAVQAPFAFHAKVGESEGGWSCSPHRFCLNFMGSSWWFHVVSKVMGIPPIAGWFILENPSINGWFGGTPMT